MKWAINCDFPGYDLKSKLTRGAEGCLDFCHKTPRCNCFTFNYFYGKCYAKHMDYVSGIPAIQTDPKENIELGSICAYLTTK